jgi:hypothetical protein
MVLALACVFAVRLLTPAGFMPAFDRGEVTIVVCPDAIDTSGGTSGHHHDGAPKKGHQPCPYAAASGSGLPAAELPFFVAPATVGLALLLGRAFLFLERSRLRERPPLRGPPLPAGT